MDLIKLKNVHCYHILFVFTVLFIIVHLNIFKFNNPITFIYKSYFQSFKNCCSPLDQEFRFQYFYFNTTIYGTPFDKRWNSVLQKLNLLTFPNVDDHKVINSEPVIVTAISSNHYRECLALLDSIQKYFTKKLVFVYDLGITSIERKDVFSKYKNIIIEIRDFSYSNYPPYFKKLREFRWKALVVAEILKDHPSVFWMDSSVRVINRDGLSYFTERVRKCNEKFEKSLCKTYPWLLIADHSHSIYAATDPVTYDYLPMPTKIAKNLTMHPATMQLIYATDHVKRNALRYWVLCALEEECMAPANSTIDCSFTSDRYRDYAKCHRQDQSAINLILTTLNDFDAVRYSDDGLHKIEVDRF